MDERVILTVKRRLRSTNKMVAKKEFQTALGHVEKVKRGLLQQAEEEKKPADIIKRLENRYTRISNKITAFYEAVVAGDNATLLDKADLKLVRHWARRGQKRVPPAYMKFAAAQRLLPAYAGMRLPDQSKAFGTLWKSMSDQDKAVYGWVRPVPKVIFRAKRQKKQEVVQTEKVVAEDTAGQTVTV